MYESFRKSYLSIKLIIFISLCKLLQSSQTFECSLQQLSQICKQQNPQAVCAKNNQNQYFTFTSACQACQSSTQLSYKIGACNCPDISCLQGQECIEQSCILLDNLEQQQLRKMAYNLIMKEKHDQALLLIQHLLKLNQKNDYIFYLASLASYEAQKYKQSLKYIKKAIEIDPNVSGYYIIRGRAFVQNQQYQEADKQFKKALELGFQDLGLIAFYQALNMLKNGKNQQAIEKFEQALKYHPQKTQWYVRKAMAHVINKQIRMALITCKQGLKIDPENKQIKLFMKQFGNIDLGNQQKLQKTQQENQKQQIYDQRKHNYGEIENIIKQKIQQKQYEFDLKRIQQKGKQKKAMKYQKSHKAETKQERNGTDLKPDFDKVQSKQL